MRVFILTFLFIACAVANKAAGKWQLLFFYQVYKYQEDALGRAGSEMALDCSKSGGCDLESFVKNMCRWEKKVTNKGEDGKPIKPITFHQEPDFDGADWKAIGDGETFNQDKFSSEMDRVRFQGLFLNPKLFKNWDEKSSNFEKVMGEVEKIVEKAQAQLTAKNQPVSNARYKALQDALQIHADARRYDQATSILDDFRKRHGEYTIKLGDEIARPHVPPYRKIDAHATITENGLEGKKAGQVRNWVTNYNASGNSKGHMIAIFKATDMQKKFAAACGSK